MKYLFLLLPFVALGQQPDKIKHYVAGASISAISYSLVANRASHRDALLISFASGVVAGVAKEIYDSKGNGTQDVNDAIATALGSFTFTVTINLLSNQLSRHHR
jgi:hypothetical protein